MYGDYDLGDLNVRKKFKIDHVQPCRYCKKYPMIKANDVYQPQLGCYTISFNKIENKHDALCYANKVTIYDTENGILDAINLWNEWNTKQIMFEPKSKLKEVHYVSCYSCDFKTNCKNCKNKKDIELMHFVCDDYRCSFDKDKHIKNQEKQNANI